MNTIQINGKTIQTPPGSNISINGGVVTVNGKLQANVDGDITISGNKNINITSLSKVM